MDHLIPVSAVSVVLRANVIKSVRCVLDTVGSDGFDMVSDCVL